jgi:hypothetical protein
MQNRLFDPPIASKIILGTLRSMLPKDSTTLYLDGGKTVEKQMTIKKRAKTAKKGKEKLTTHLEAVGRPNG